MTEKPETVLRHGKPWPLLSASEMAAALGCSADWLRQLERAGRFEKVGRNAYDPLAVFLGVLAHFRDEERRAAKSGAAADLQKAKAEEVRLRIAREQGQLVYADSSEKVVLEVVGAFRSRLAGIPAAVTRDLAIRDKIDELIDAAVLEVRAHMAKMKAQLIAEAKRGRRK
jgi:phage terminase Nu1 subunit (DNA packaging protein)